jgi:hypothetical protein
LGNTTIRKLPQYIQIGEIGEVFGRKTSSINKLAVRPEQHNACKKEQKTWTKRK